MTSSGGKADEMTMCGLMALMPTGKSRWGCAAGARYTMNVSVASDPSTLGYLYLLARLFMQGPMNQC